MSYNTSLLGKAFPLCGWAAFRFNTRHGGWICCRFWKHL